MKPDTRAGPRHIPEAASRAFGEISGRHPAVVLAVRARAVAALAPVLGFGGLQGVGTCLSRLGLGQLPALCQRGTVRSGWVFAPFFVGCACISLFATPLLDASRGSVPWSALFHCQVNKPLWPDAQPCDTGFLVAAAVPVVWIKRRSMLTRDGAVAEVFAPRTHARSSP